MDLAAKAARAVPGLVLSDAPVDRVAYGRDLWPRHHLDVRAGRVVEGSRPALIAWPTTTEQAAATVRFCREEGVPMVPFGAGSGVCGGVLPQPTALVIDLKRMGAVRKLDPSEPSLDVEAGAMGITLEESLQRKGWTIGHFPSSILCSTVGGWLAARGAGQCSGRYGKIEDMVAAIELVDGRGQVATLRRRQGGLDLTPLIVGSEGTLGVITSCTLRLHPAPLHRSFSAYSFPDVEAGWEAMRRLFQAGLRPAVSRLYDPFDSALAKQGNVRRSLSGHGGDDHHKGPGGGHRALGLLLRRPQLLNQAIDALGGRALGGSTLVLIFEGPGDEAHDDGARAAALAAELGGRPLGEGPARKWLQHRYSVSYRQAPVFRSNAFSDTFEVAAPWSRLKALYDGVRRALGRRVFVMAHLSHAYPDGCCIYFSFAGSAPSDEASERIYDETWASAMAAAIEAGGTISHHHGVGRSKAPRLGSELGAGVDVVRALMRAFDPSGLLNPGNLLPRDEPRPLSPPAAPDGFAIDERSRLAQLPADLTLGEASALLDRAGFALPLAAGAAVDPQQRVGAWIDAGAPGSFDPWLDPCDHLLAGLRAELPTGQRLAVHPCPRRAAGPDLTALFLGGGGRFGRLTSIDLRVRARDDAPARPLPYAGPRSPAPSSAEENLAERIAGELR